MYSIDKLGISRFGQWGVPNLVMAASNHIVAAIRELGTQWHQREIPSLFIYLIYHTNGNRQTLLSASCQALSDCPVLRRAQSWQYRDRRKPKAGTMPYSYFEWLQGFFIVHSIIGSTVHFMPLNSLRNIYARSRWQISVPTGIRTWYPQVTSPSRYEWAIGAGLKHVMIGQLQLYVVFYFSK